MFCPNVNSPEWKTMVAKVGEDQAYINWLNGKYVVNDSYQQRSSNQEEITLDQFEQQRQQIANTFNSEVIIDETLGASASVRRRAKKNVIAINPNKLFRDTLTHEYGHIFIDALGGMSNPMIRAGYNQIKDTKIANEVREEYSDRAEDVIQKEILNRFITAETVDVLVPKSKLDSFLKWLDLFYNRVKSMFGFEADRVKLLASKMLSMKDSSGLLVDNIYEQRVRDLKLDSVKKFFERKVDSLTIKLKEYNQVYEEGTESQQKFQKEIEDTRNEMQKLLDEYHDTKARQGIVSYIANTQSVLSRVEARMKKYEQQKNEEGEYDLSASELQRLKEYISSYKDIEDLSNMLSEEPSFAEQYEEFGKEMDLLIAKYKRLDKGILSLQKKLVATRLAENRKSPTALQYKQKFQTEFDKIHNNTGFWGGNTLNGRKVSKDEYTNARDIFVNKKMEQERNVIIEKEFNRMQDVLQEVPMEAGIWDMVRNTGDINDDLIQEAVELIETQARIINDKTINLANEYNGLFEDFKREHGISNSMEATYDKLIDNELDRNGNPTGKKIEFMSGEYNASFYKHNVDYQIEINELQSEVNSLEEGDPTFKEMNDKLQSLIEEHSKWFKENTEVISGVRRIKDKWRNNQELSESEQNLKDFLVERRKQMYEKVYGVKGANLNKEAFNTTFYELPHVSKTGFEKITDHKNPFSVAQKWYQERFTLQGDDVDYKDASYKIGSEDNKLIQTQPIFFRNKTSDQSYDLLSIHLLDEHMAIKYDQHRKIIPTLEMLKDVSAQREVRETESEFGEGFRTLMNRFSNNKELAALTKKGIDTKNHKILTDYIGAMIYGDTKSESGKISKVLDTLISLTSKSIMSMNWIASIPNILTGQVNKITDSMNIAGINHRDMAKGDKLYWKDFGSIIGDLGNIRPQSFTNLLMEYFQPAGDFNAQYPEFAKSNKTKQIFDSDLAWINSSAGEHYIHGGIMYGMLNSVKLLNKDGKYINEEGKPTDNFKDAVSLVEYMQDKIDEQGFNLNKKSKFDVATKTSFSNTKLGKDLLNEVAFKMRDIAVSTQGLYANDMWMHAKQYAAFRAVMSLRGWAIPGIDRRWRGITNFNAENELERTLPSRRRGSILAGSYTDTIRFLNQQKKNLLKLRFDILGSDWESLNSRERANVRETALEASIYGFLAASSIVFGRLAGEIEDKEDARYIVHLLYNMERVKTEIGFYANPKEFLRIMRSPAPVLSMTVNVVGLIDQVTEDITNWELERYERGAMKGQPKVKKKLFQVLPVFSQINRDVEKTMEYIKNPAIR